MKTLKRTRYNTTNSWNNTTAPAYNLKVYNVIDVKLQNKVYELMEIDGFYNDINFLIDDFNAKNDYKYQARFNGRSGGYLVLYKGGQKNFTFIEENNEKCGRCGAAGRYNREFFEIYTKTGQSIKENDAPANVLKAFRQLAVDIVETVEYMAEHTKVREEEYTKTRKILTEI